MRYAWRWNTRQFGTQFLASENGDYNPRAPVASAFTPDLGEALLYRSVQEATNSLQRRVKNMGDTNHKLQLVRVQGGNYTVTGEVS